MSCQSFIHGLVSATMKRTNIKRTVSLVLMGSVMCGLISIASASDFTLGRSYEWSPYTSSNKVTTYSTSIRAIHRFYFDKTAADAVNAILYFTMEENCGDGTALSIGEQYSNLPDPHFDEDDDDGDGYSEESEVVMGISGNVDISTDYYFLTWWHQAGDVSSGNVNFIAQRSAYNPISHEYDALMYDLLEQSPYGPLPMVASATTYVCTDNNNFGNTSAVGKVAEYQNDGYSEIIEENNSGKTISVHPLIETISDVSEYAKMQSEKIDNIRNQMAYSALDSSIIRDAQVTVTFDGAISQTDLENLLKKSGAKFVDCEVKLLDENGMWVTAHIRDLTKIDSIDEIRELEDRVSEGSKCDVEYCGITSARLNINLMDDSYERLSKSNQVFFADMMDTIVRSEHQDEEGKMRIRVFDMAWLLAEAKGEI